MLTQFRETASPQERLILARQDEVLHRLVEMMRRARQDGDEALVLATQAAAA
jgi:hypothetical protein